MKDATNVHSTKFTIELPEMAGQCSIFRFLEEKSAMT